MLRLDSSLRWNDKQQMDSHICEMTNFGERYISAPHYNLYNFTNFSYFELEYTT